MSAYAILGATGQVGGSILSVLGANPLARIHVLVRSRAKLKKSYPGLSSSPNIVTYEGTITDIPLLTAYLADTHSIFLTVAVNEIKPGVNISVETAHAVVLAQQSLQTKSPQLKIPRQVVLSSASLDDQFWNGVPAFVHKLLYASNAHIYDDLARAQTYLEQQENWLDITFVTPGGLSHDVPPREYELTLERQQTFISFLDLVAGMLQVAEEGERWAGKHVSAVLKEGAKAKIDWFSFILLEKRLLCHVFPWLYGWLP